MAQSIITAVRWRRPHVRGGFVAKPSSPIAVVVVQQKLSKTKRYTQSVNFTTVLLNRIRLFAYRTFVYNKQIDILGIANVRINRLKCNYKLTVQPITVYRPNEKYVIKPVTIIAFNLHIAPIVIVNPSPSGERLGTFTSGKRPNELQSNARSSSRMTGRRVRNR